MASLRPYLECSICLAYHKEPKVLSCFHVFCLQCIKTFDGMETIKCPLCRQLTYVPEGGVQELPDYTSKEETLPEGNDHCGFCCNDTVAEFYCRECEDSLCLKCKEQHMRMKQTKDHALDVLEARQVSKKIENLPCNLHRSYEVQSYCSTCEQGCCEICCRRNHENHIVGPLHETAEERRQQIRTNIEESKTRFTGVVKDIADILFDQYNLNAMQEKCMQDIDRIADELKRKIDSVSETMKEDLRETCETLNDKLAMSLETNKTKSKSIISVVQSTSEILNEATDLDLLGLERDILYQLNEEKASACVKDVRVSYLSYPNTEESMWVSLEGQAGFVSGNIIQPLVLNKVTRPVKVHTKNISAMACLTNGSILVCDDHTRQISTLSVRGEDFGSFAMPFKVGNFVHLDNSSLLLSEYNGKRVAKFCMISETVAVRKFDAFVSGVSLTGDETSVIWCCNDVKAESKDNKSRKGNGKIIITDADLDIQVQINIKCGGEVLRYAVQKRNGDFVAVTTKTCYILSSLGIMKSSYSCGELIHAVCVDKQNNFLILHGENEQITLSVYDSSFVSSKDVCSFTCNLPGNMKCNMALDNGGSLWVGFNDRIECIKYTF